MKRPVHLGVDNPSFRRTPLRDPASPYAILGGGSRSGPTPPLREAKGSGVGSPLLELCSSLGTPARCEWLSKVRVTMR